MNPKISDIQNPKEKIHFLEEKGYLFLPNVFDAIDLKKTLKTIKKNLNECACDLSCSYEEYMASVSRWVDPSPVIEEIKEDVLNPLKCFLESFMGPCGLSKLNLISKTPFSSSPLPFHQDISYSPQSPYQFSAWLALTESPLESGPLEVIIGSHKNPVETAVDFWDPAFEDSEHLLKGVKTKISAKTGDLILFDSCLWHGSSKNELNHERFALVSRWTQKNYKPPHIPVLQPRPFGMWTCQKKTQEILEIGLQTLSGRRAQDYDDLLKEWESFLENDKIHFLENIKKAKEDLKCVQILNKAHQKHNGGDAQGVLYAQLWHSLLSPLMQYLNKSNGVRNGKITSKKNYR